MKTITEFSGFTLKEAISKKAALIAEGKTEDEAQASVNEMLKLDETKASLYKNAVDMTSSRMDRVKRVVIAVKANDAEKVPEAFMEREGHFYLIEYFPQADTRGARKEESSSYHDDFARGRTGGGRGRGGDRGRGGRDGGRGNDRGRDGGRGRGPGGRDGEKRTDSRGPRPEGAARTEGARPDRGPRPPRGDGRGERKPRPPRDPNAPPRAPRPPREPREPRGPKGAGELRLVLKGQATTLPGSGPAVSAAQAAPATETSTTPNS